MLATIRTTAPVENQFKQIDYQVVHTTIGRFRLCIPRVASDSEYSSKLTWLVESLDFVISVRINPVAKSVIIKYDASVAASAEVKQHLVTAIQQASMAHIVTGAIPTKPEFSTEIKWERLGLSVFSLGLALLASELALPIPSLAITGAIAAAAIPLLTTVFDTVVNERRFDTDILDAFWISFHTVKGDFVASALTLSLIESGNALRNTTQATQCQAVELLNDLDQYAWVERNGEQQRLPLKQVQIGDIVIVYCGELIPVDGLILSGKALIDEHKLTGESTLLLGTEGQAVYASTLVTEGQLCVLVERVGNNTRAGLAWELMQKAPLHDTRVENYAAIVANAAIFPILCLSGIIFALTGDATRALAPLQLDCCNGIGIAVPTTILSALTYAARNGVYIRSGHALEVLARTDTVVFDKTGTLTQGRAVVVGVRTVDAGIGAYEVLSLAASAQQGNTHPVASALQRYAKANGVQTHKCETWDYQIGLGITAVIAGQTILVGSNNLMRQAGVDLDPINIRYPDINSETNSLVYIARDGELLGVILYTDPVRPEVKSAIATLHSLGIVTYMLTGDNQQVAKDVASELGIDLTHTYAEVLPEQKLEFICWLRNQGKTVAFVGEGINDVAALAHADVSLSFASGCALARETADVVLLADDLRGLTHAIDIAKQAMEIIYLNTAIAVIPNISVAIAGIVFALDPILEVIISNVSAIIAQLNSFSPLFFDAKKEHNTIFTLPSISEAISEELKRAPAIQLTAMAAASA